MSGLGAAGPTRPGAAAASVVSLGIDCPTRTARRLGQPAGHWWPSRTPNRSTWARAPGRGSVARRLVVPAVRIDLRPGIPERHHHDVARWRRRRPTTTLPPVTPPQVTPPPVSLPPLTVPPISCRRSPRHPSRCRSHRPTHRCCRSRCRLSAPAPARALSQTRNVLSSHVSASQDIGELCSCDDIVAGCRSGGTTVATTMATTEKRPPATPTRRGRRLRAAW